MEVHGPREVVVQGGGEELPGVLGDECELRRSIRESKPPERYEAKW